MRIKTARIAVRVTEQFRQNLQQAATAAERSLSEQILYMLDRVVLYERLLGELESFQTFVTEVRPPPPPTAEEIKLAIRQRVADIMAANMAKQGEPNNDHRVR